MMNPVNYKDEDEDRIAYEYEKTKEVKWYHRILLNRPIRVIIPLIFLALVAPVLIYKYLFFYSVDWAPSDGHSFGSCLVQRAARLPCGAGNIPRGECHPQCCFDLDNNFCFHRFPSRFSYIMDQPWNEEVVLIPRISTVPFASQNSVTRLRLSIDEISSTHLSLSFYDAREMSLQGNRRENKEYSYRISSPELNVIVDRLNGIPIFNTGRGPLIASENIWELTFKLTEESMFGLGELPLQEGAVKMLYNHDGGLSSIPLIYAQSNGSYHGLLIDVSDPTEVTVAGDNQIMVRSITTSGLKFHLFLGPEPKDVMRDVLDLMGQKMELEYWTLGAHLCSEIVEDENEAITYLESFLENATSDNLPYESHCGLGPIVFNAEYQNEVTVLISEGAKLVKAAGKKFVPHVSPYIRYEPFVDVEDNNSTENATELRSNNCSNILCEFEEHFLRWNLSHVYQGVVDSVDDSVLYPDYEIVSDDFMEKLWVTNVDSDVDGVVLENNWPLDQSLKSHEDSHKQLPYFNENFELAFNRTPQWNIIRPNGELYFEKHNMYGNNFVKSIGKVNNNIPVWSTSQWMKNVLINRQNVHTSWSNLHNELIESALGGISGNWQWTSPICGDTTNFDVDNQASLCVKWYMAATYFPFVKIHSKATARDPLAFIGAHRALILNALHNRLALSPYFYSVLQEGPLLRPMFYQFPYSDDLKELRSQFSVGDSLLIAPNLQPSQTHVHVRVPPGTWYEFWSGLRIEAEEGDVVTMTTTEADFLTFIRGGSLVVTQMDVRSTAEATRKNSSITLMIATESVNVTTHETTEVRHAEGKLYISKNMTINFKMNDTSLTITTHDEEFSDLCGDDAVSANVINEIKIYGLAEKDNNYDYHKQLNVAIDLCDLVNGEIVYSLT